MAQFKDRHHAGKQLAEALSDYAGRDDVIVLALPRGGVEVGYEIAMELDLPLDIVLVRKLGVPGNPELAMGAIASGGVRVLNRDVVETLNIAQEDIDRAAERERRELERREETYRGERGAPDVEGKTVILVDDGLATGATMRAVIDALQQRNPAQTVVAVGTAPPETCQQMEERADRVVCLATPRPFFGVGGSYRDFSQTTDEQVHRLLREAWDRGHGAEQ